MNKYCREYEGLTSPAAAGLVTIFCSNTTGLLPSPPLQHVNNKIITLFIQLTW